MQAMFAVMDNMDNIDALNTAVREVLKELEKFGAKRLVDPYKIYELLETHYLGSDRVQFVTTHLLVSLGLRSNFGEEDIINVPDVLNDPDKTVREEETPPSKQKFYSCNTCNKKFERRPSYRSHYRTHDKDRFSCATCYKTFYDKSNLKKHCRIHSGDRPFSCDLCDKKYSDPTGLKCHKRQNH